MNVNTMRFLDRYLGIPLCWLMGVGFSLWERLCPPKPQAPRRVLLIELSEMGSAILADPAMRWLKQQGAVLHFVIFKDNVGSLKLLNTVPANHIYTLRAHNLCLLAWDTLTFLRWCRRQRIDTVIDLELFSRFTALLTRLSGATNRVGYAAVHNEGLYRGNHLTHPVMYNPHQHIAKNFMVLVQAAFATPGQPYQRIIISDQAITLAKAEVSEPARQAVFGKMQTLAPTYPLAQHRLMLVNPNASDLLPQRRWPVERFAQVINTVLASYPDVLVIITGAAAERAEAERLKQLTDHRYVSRCVNSAGVFLFAELVPLYSLATLLLSNDSGPPHFAAVTDLPTFVLFGPETPALYGALGNTTPIYAGLACSPCVSASNHRKTSCTDNQCLRAITAAAVFTVIKPTLDGQA